MNAMLLLLLLIVPLVTLSLAPNVQFRGGKTSDQLTITTTMARELMNPLGIQPERFLVAVEENNKDDRPIGWAQIRPLGTSQRDPSKYDSRRGSFDVERDADDAMWDEFEQDENAVVPSGLSSLPWTKEYRAFAEAARKRRERRAEIVERERASMPMLFELSSVYVKPEYRGKGIGTELIKRVLQRHVNEGHSMSDVYVLTLATTAGWYNDSFGFDVVRDEEVPAQMSFEITAGKLVTNLIGAKLCCMRGLSE